MPLISQLDRVSPGDVPVHLQFFVLVTLHIILYICLTRCVVLGDNKDQCNFHCQPVLQSPGKSYRKSTFNVYVRFTRPDSSKPAQKTVGILYGRRMICCLTAYVEVSYDHWSSSTDTAKKDRNTYPSMCVTIHIRHSGQ